MDSFRKRRRFTMKFEYEMYKIQYTLPNINGKNSSKYYLKEINFHSNRYNFIKIIFDKYNEKYFISQQGSEIYLLIVHNICNNALKTYDTSMQFILLNSIF